MTSRLTTLLAAVSLGALTLSACGSNSLDTQPQGGGSDQPSVQVSKDDALAAKLPDKIKSANTIVIGTDASYAPNEFLNPDGKTVEGMDVDLFNSVAKQFGVDVQWQPADFDSIINGVNSGKYDMGISSFTINAQRQKVVNMVSYFEAGTQWAAPAGNPKQVDPENPCGKTIAVQQGTVQEEDDLPVRQKKCGSNKIKILPYGGQDQATAAVASGKADAMLADSPVTAYAVQQSQGKLATLGDVYDAAPYGWVVPKKDTEFADALAQALKQAKQNGSYDAALKKWGVENGATDSFDVNPEG